MMLDFVLYKKLTRRAVMRNISDTFLNAKKESCEREITRIRSLNQSLDQALAYEAQLFDVLNWQGLSLTIKNDFTFIVTLEAEKCALIFWPITQNSIDNKQKLGLDIIDDFLKTEQVDVVLASSLVGFSDDLLEYSNAQNGKVLLLDGTDINALCNIDWFFSEMIEFKQREMRLYGQPSVNYLAYSGKRVKNDPYNKMLTKLELLLSRGEDTSAKMFREDIQARWIDFEKGLIIEWPQVNNAVNILKEPSYQRDVIIISGIAGSGKSTFLFSVGHKYHLDTGSTAYYVNAASLKLENIENLIDEALSLPDGSILLFDDLHQRAVLSNKVIGAICSETKNVKIVAATRPPYFGQVEERLHGTYGWRPFQVRKINLEPKEIVDKIILKFNENSGFELPEGVAQTLKRDVGQDLTVFGWVMRHMVLDRAQTKITYEEAMAKYRLMPLAAQENGAAALALLYVVTYFEQFDIKIKKDFLVELGFTPDLIQRLFELGYLISSAEMLGVGHANLARLYIQSLDKHIEMGWSKVLGDYLRNKKSEFTLEDLKLKLLDNYFSRRDVEARSRAMLNVFEYFSDEFRFTPLHQDMIRTVSALERAMAMLILYFQRDPTAEHSVSNSAFICQAFAKFGLLDMAKQAVDFMQSQQTVQNNKAYFILDPLRVTTVRDFQEIKKTVHSEEENPDRATVELITKVENIINVQGNLAERTDFDRFHQTWLSAMVLPSILMVYGKDNEKFTQTLNSVLGNQDPELGWYYPPEFCWSTARNVINLVDVGMPIDSPAVQNGSKWLLNIQLDDGRWRSPDWRWNPDEEMTAMCLYAVLKSGVSVKHPSVKKAYKWLLSKKENGCWNNNAHDTGHVVEAFNALNLPMDNLREPLRFLERRVSQDDWYQTVIGKERRQSLEIGELANVLLEVETKYLFEYVKSVIVAKN